MIEQTPVSAPGDAVCVVLLPNRSISRRGLLVFLVAQGVFAGAFAAMAAWSGNVFAPLFALVEFSIVAYCVQRVWRTAQIGEVITLTPALLEVARTDHAQALAQFHPYWARLILRPGRWRGWPSRLLICSHGNEVEVGAFLNDHERRQLAQKLAALLSRNHGDATPQQRFDAR